MHDVAFRVDDEGNVTFIYHPNDEAARRAALELGEVQEDRRAGYVWPRRASLQLAFRALRKIFGSRGPISDWTRSWRCQWIVVDAQTGERLPGVYSSHGKAVEAEVSWSLAHGYPEHVIAIRNRLLPETRSNWQRHIKVK